MELLGVGGSLAGTLPLAIVITLKKVRAEREDYISRGIKEKNAAIISACEQSKRTGLLYGMM